MKVFGLLVTLALMQMSCLADGFYFCFKPACTKTYLKFDEKQFKTHLVKKHGCKAVTSKIMKFADGETFVVDGSAKHFWDGENTFFEYAENVAHMKEIISVQKPQVKVTKNTQSSNSEPLIYMSNMKRCYKCNQEVPVRFFDAHDIDHQRSEMRQYNRRRF